MAASKSKSDDWWIFGPCRSSVECTNHQGVQWLQVGFTKLCGTGGMRMLFWSVVIVHGFSSQINRAGRISIFMSIVEKLGEFIIQIVMDTTQYAVTWAWWLWANRFDCHFLSQVYCSLSNCKQSSSGCLKPTIEFSRLGKFWHIRPTVWDRIEGIDAKVHVRPNRKLHICFQHIHWSRDICHRQLMQTLQISGSINVLLFRQAPLGGEVADLKMFLVENWILVYLLSCAGHLWTRSGSGKHPWRIQVQQCGYFFDHSFFLNSCEWYAAKSPKMSYPLATGNILVSVKT